MDSTLKKIVSRDVRPAMELIYGLRECGVEQDIEIPQVAVIGDQSSGKSSVLESICSLPLPRGAGLTTRCAIELRLSDSSAHNQQEWRATIATSRKPKPISVSTMEELESAIAERAKELVDPHRNGGFSRERIIVEISSPGAPNLTLIDLPGIIRTETTGQDKGAVREVKELIKNYVDQERTILLVVIPCTQDIATIEALEWASNADRTGKRTIGVLTKPDLIDDGAEHEVAEVLSNKRKPLSLGYIMLKNRSQREVAERLSYADARENEIEYFASHHIWSSMRSELFGVEHLVEKITKVLVTQIHDALPTMKAEVIKKLDSSVTELEEVGLGAGETPAQASLTLMRILFDYNNILSDSAAGRYVHKKLWDPKLRLCTRVRQLYDDFKTEILETRPNFENDDEFVAEIAREILGSRGRELPGFLNPRIFESRVAQYVETWRESSKKLISDANELVREVSHDLFTMACPEFPGLRSKMHDVISNTVQSLKQATEDEVEGVFKREVGQPFTLNDQFLASVNARRLQRFDAVVYVALQKAGKDGRGTPKDKDVAKLLRAWYERYHCSGSTARVNAEAEDMTTMLGCYWDVAADRFVDNHVMALENSLIKPLAGAIQVTMNKIVVEVGKSEDALNVLLAEDVNLVRRRKELIAARDRLQKARELIDKY